MFLQFGFWRKYNLIFSEEELKWVSTQEFLLISKVLKLAGQTLFLLFHFFAVILFYILEFMEATKYNLKFNSIGMVPYMHGRGRITLLL